MSSEEDRSAAREAFALPLLFLSVALLGGFRLPNGGAAMEFRPPPLMALVLSVQALGAMVQAGLLAPGRLMSEERGALANLSGAVVLFTLLLATAQVFNGLTPDTGLPALLWNVFFFVLLSNTLAAQPDRLRLLRSLLVIFGSAFVFKYVVLEAMADPQAGLARRLVTALLEGISLGSYEARSFHPATGYVAFANVLLYAAGLVMLPSRRTLAAGTALVARPSGDIVDVDVAR